MAVVAQRARPLLLQVRVAPIRFLALVGAAPLLLGVGRLLPAEGAGLVVRLTAAAACILLVPGAVVFRALGGPLSIGLGIAGALTWSLTALFAALAITFLTGGSIGLTLGLLVLVAAAALIRVVTSTPAPIRARGGLAALAVLAGGAVLAYAVWWSADSIQGDALFHLARVRKLETFDLTSLRVVDEFRDGGLHPGYAFPLWHAAVALISRLAGVDPALAFVRLPAILTPLALVLAYAAGAALFRSWPGGLATALAQAGLLGFVRAGTGSFELLALPGTAARLLLVPALLALVFAFAANGSRVVLLSIAAAALALAAVHPTYVFFVALALVGFLLARLLLVRDRRGVAARIAAALAAALVPAGAFAAWLWPVVSATASHSPSAAQTAQDLAHYHGQLVGSNTSYHLAPALISRSGAPVVAALLAIPLAALAARRAWAAFILGGSLTILAVALVSPAFTALADVASLSQARRLIAFLPLSFALAGAATALARLKLVGCLAAFGAGTGLQLLYPGEFSYHFVKGGPGWVVWLSVAAGTAGLVAAVALGRSLLGSDTPWVAVVAAALVAPMAFDGLSHLSRGVRDPDALSPGLLRALRADVRPQDVVFGNLEASYRIAAYVPAYIAAAPPAHVADTPANHPQRRVRDLLEFFRTGDLTIPRRYGARWLVVDRRRTQLPRALLPVYADKRYELFRL